MNKILGWIAIVGLGALIYSQYKEAQKKKLTVKFK
jgi:hypothetical protein